MRVLVVGSGGREHALVWGIARSDPGGEILCVPGNGGIAELAECVAGEPVDAEAIATLAQQRRCDLVVVGPDAALAAGVVDACVAAGVPAFGPSAAAARLESSKLYAKWVMDRAGIPTAGWAQAGEGSRERAHEFIDACGGRCVVKADGLALGKGVVVCDGVHQARAAVADCLDGGRFGAAGHRVVVEERLSGPEVSVFALCDGGGARMLGCACDYKRAGDGDTGPNTGGMGVYAPYEDDESGLVAWSRDQVVAPVMRAMAAEGTPFAGCLYVGLMLTADGPRVLEFNVRFGDPEAQVLIPLMAEPLLPLLMAAATGAIVPGTVARRPGAAVGVVVADSGYPGAVTPGRPTAAPDEGPDQVLFHAGTRRTAAGGLVTAGGRVFTCVGLGPDWGAARECAYAMVSAIGDDGLRWRSDIAARPASHRWEEGGG